MTREEAIAVLESDAEYMYSQDSPYNKGAYLMAINALKAEPIKHGRWLKTGQSFISPKKFRNYFCSECGFELDKSIRTKYRYCPNCGARMNAQIGEDKSHPFAESVMMGKDGGEK